MRIKHNRPSVVTLKLKLDKDSPVLRQLDILPTWTHVPDDLCETVMGLETIKDMIDCGRIEVCGEKKKPTVDEIKRMINSEEVPGTIEELMTLSSDAGVQKVGKARLKKVKAELEARIKKNEES
jgi:hypothetical protein